MLNSTSTLARWRDEITPKTIYWIGFPDFLTHDHLIDVLKKDIFIIPQDPCFKSYYQLTKTVHSLSLYFFNIDVIMKENNIYEKHANAFHKSFPAFITEHFFNRSLVYSFSREISGDEYEKAGIFFSCFSDKTKLLSSIINLANNLFAGLERNTIDITAERSSFRLPLLPLKYGMEVSIPGEKREKALPGYVKDISLNGIGCIFEDKHCLHTVRKNSPLDLKLYLHNTPVSIKSTVVSRINLPMQEIGVEYDINDHRTISETHSDTLSSLIYTWLNQVVSQYYGTVPHSI